MEDYDEKENNFIDDDGSYGIGFMCLWKSEH